MELNSRGYVDVLGTYGNASIKDIVGSPTPSDKLKGVNSSFVNGEVAQNFAKPGLINFDESVFPKASPEDIKEKLEGVRSIFSDIAHEVLDN